MVDFKEFKKMACVAVVSIILAALIFAWYAFGAPLTHLNLANDVYQFIVVGVGVLMCFAVYILSKPEF
ncbi:MAG: hypothetical protein LBE57_01950 [Methanosarcinales archaeon]|jgi:hypothetical protein|nr:hypothetical protein [Methanosarcinales archaeon]